MITLHDVDTAIDRRRLLTHPFYVAWEKGLISKEGLRDYSTQYYFVECSLTGLAVGDEWEDEATHPDLWLRFTRALGLPDDEVKNADLRPATRKLIEFNEQAGKSDATRNAALYAYESQAVDIATVKQRSLTEQYAMSEGLDFFRVHAEVEGQHAAAGRAQLELSATALDSLETALDLHWDFLTQAQKVDEAVPA